MVLLLTESPQGYGLFKVKDSTLSELKDTTDINQYFQKEEFSQKKQLKMEAFQKFTDTKMQMEECSQIQESKVGSELKKFLKKNYVKKGLQDELGVIDKQLQLKLKEDLSINVQFSEQVRELQRGLRMNLDTLIEDLTQKDQEQMQLSLQHSMSRFKLKFSPDKVDTMIVQQIGLLDDLDKELNNFQMRLKEWYGWHFPELQKILNDGLVYQKQVLLMGMRSNCKDCDFSKIGVPEEIEEELKKQQETSYGTEITEEDLENIKVLQARVQELLEYRQDLQEYLKVRMSQIQPNLTYLVGDLVGQRLISHQGSLMNLQKHPQSTIQVLGQEKQLFRQMKQKTNTPKYGLLYHQNLVGKTHSKFKGKISRVLQAKMQLQIRVDQLSENQSTEQTVQKQFRDYIEKRIEAAEDGDDIAQSRRHLKKADLPKEAELKKEEDKTYNQAQDQPKEEKKKKEKKDKKRKREETQEEQQDQKAEEPQKKKKKKSKKQEPVQ